MNLSVVIVSWNTCDLTRSCLQTLEAERETSVDFSFEVIVVDNQSQDETVSMVQQEFPWVFLLPQEENLGFAAGNNRGFQVAKGKYVLLLNSDTEVRSGSLQSMVQFLEDHPAVGVIGPQLVNPDESKQNCIHNFPSLLTELVPKGLLETFWPRAFPSKRFEHSGPIEVDAVLGACLMVRREIIEATGGMPEEYFLFLEETDWWWQIRDLGWKIMHLPEIRIMHVSGASSKKRIPASTRIEYHRSLYRFFRKHRGRVSAWLVMGYRVFKGVFYFLTLMIPAMVSEKQRHRWKVSIEVLGWHLRGCPRSAGLRQAKLPTGETS